MSLRFCTIVLLFFCFACGNNSSHEQYQEIDESHGDYKVYPINHNQGRCDLSGLVEYNGALYTINDKNDHTIFRIDRGAVEADLVPAIEFDAPGLSFKLDFEGITCDEQGNFYLISESEFRILKVTQEGGSEWVTPSFEDIGKENGFFTKRNANFEGIARIGNGEFVMAVERQPRGVFVWRDSVLSTFKMDSSIFELPNHRPPDYTGMYFFEGNIYALNRNACSVSLLTELEFGFVEDPYSNFSMIESRAYVYEDNKYGTAEGLALNKTHVFVIVDNNDDARLSNPDDKRPLLFVKRR